jgi:sec-independent protein translocase protein TatB
VFGISGTEVFFIVVFALIIFGPDKLPQMGRTVGRFMREFKRAQENVESLLRAELYSTEKSEADATLVDSAATPEVSVPTYGDDVDDEEEDEE